MLSGNGKDVLEKQLKLAGHENKYVRYWASIGLFSQTEWTQSDIDRVEELYETESFEPARINLSVLIYRERNDGGDLNRMKNLVHEDDLELLRMALNLLLTLDEELQYPLLPDVEQWMADHKGQKNISACNDYMKLFVHKLKGGVFKGNDSF